VLFRDALHILKVLSSHFIPVNVPISFRYQMVSTGQTELASLVFPKFIFVGIKYELRSLNFSALVALIQYIIVFAAFAFAELVDNALAATADNKADRNIEIRLVS
jgi:hypothetical protein